jgi:hypothetical protein
MIIVVYSNNDIYLMLITQVEGMHIIVKILFCKSNLNKVSSIQCVHIGRIFYPNKFMHVWRAIIFPFITSPIICRLWNFLKISSWKIVVSNEYTLLQYEDCWLYFDVSISSLVVNLQENYSVLIYANLAIAYMFHLEWRILWDTQFFESSHIILHVTLSNMHEFLLLHSQTSFRVKSWRWVTLLWETGLQNS